MAKSTSQVSSDRRRRRSDDDPVAQLKGRRFGRVLTKLGKITRDQVHEALRVQRARRDKGDRDLIGQILIELGLIGESMSSRHLPGSPACGLSASSPMTSMRAWWRRPPSRRTPHEIVPLEYDEATKVLTVAMKSPENFRGSMTCVC